MSVKAIQLRNFRGFHKAEIELKPLTVLLGPNSAGKSAFGQALAAMNHCQWKYGQSRNATLTPTENDTEDWPVDLGKISDLRFDRAKDGERVYVSLLTKEGWVDFGFGLELPEAGINNLLFSYFSYPREDTNQANRISGQTEPKPSAETQGNPLLSTGSPESLEIGDRPVFYRNDELIWRDDKSTEVNVQLDGLIVETVGPKASPGEVTLRSVARTDIRELFENLAYLRATRQRPIRSYKNETARPQAIGYAGECAAGVLNLSGDNEVVFAVPRAIPDTVEKAQSVLDEHWEERRVGLQGAVGEWLHMLGLADSVASVQSSKADDELEIRVTLESQNAHNLCDVGFGISQLIPVLTAGLMQPPGSLFIVDLPEAHLHPLPQSKLADFFCSLALSGRFSLVETHSEMFFYRLRLLAEMNSDLASSIAVYFIDPPKNGVCSHPRKIGLRFDDELRWPPGFLQEAWETESQIAIAREARRAKDK